MIERLTKDETVNIDQCLEERKRLDQPKGIAGNAIFHRGLRPEAAAFGH